MTRDWAGESVALLRRQRLRLERLLAGRPAGDEGLFDEMERFADEYDAWKAERRKTRVGGDPEACPKCGASWDGIECPADEDGCGYDTRGKQPVAVQTNLDTKEATHA
jgi:hypothetical protein